MRKVFFTALVALIAITASAKTPKAKANANKNKPVFTVIKENKITSIKDQNRSGTCWDYATLSFLESEILRNSGKTYNLSEMFIASKNYMDRCIVCTRRKLRRPHLCYQTARHCARRGNGITRNPDRRFTGQLQRVF